jgi:hypothetical protein
VQARDSSGQAWSATVPSGRDDSAAPATVWARGVRPANRVKHLW